MLRKTVQLVNRFQDFINKYDNAEGHFDLINICQDNNTGLLRLKIHRASPENYWLEAYICPKTNELIVLNENKEDILENAKRLMKKAI